MSEKYCRTCLEKLEQRENEPDYNYAVREFCNKSCASKHEGRKQRRGKTMFPPLEVRDAQVTQYERGSAEFNRLAALYGG